MCPNSWTFSHFTKCQSSYFTVVTVWRRRRPGDGNTSSLSQLNPPPSATAISLLLDYRDLDLRLKSVIRLADGGRCTTAAIANYLGSCDEQNKQAGGGDAITWRGEEISWFIRGQQGPRGGLCSGSEMSTTAQSPLVVESRALMKWIGRHLSERPTNNSLITLNHCTH